MSLVASQLKIKFLNTLVILRFGTGCPLGSVPQLTFAEKCFQWRMIGRVHRKSGLKVNVLHEKSSCKQDLGRLFRARMKV